MNKIVEIVFGSRLYGTDTPASDLDIKGIYIPTARDILLGRYAKTVASSRPKREGERNVSSDVDTEYFSLDRFLQLLVEGQCMALDMLFSPGFAEAHPITRAIYEGRHKLLSRNVNSFIGYSKTQAAKYGIKGSRLDALNKVMAWLDARSGKSKVGDDPAGIQELIDDCIPLVALEGAPLVQVVMIVGPTGPNTRGLLPHLSVCGSKFSFTSSIALMRQAIAKKHEGYGHRAHKANLDGGRDYKALSHAVRINGQAYELLTTGHITFPRPDAERLKAIKLGQVEYETVASLIEFGLADLLQAQARSSLREEPDKEFADELVVDAYEMQVESQYDCSNPDGN